MMNGQIKHQESGRPPSNPAQRIETLDAGKVQTLAALIDRGDFTAAEKLAESLTVRHPRSAFAWKTLGILLESRSELAKAEDSYRRALRLQPDAAQIASNLGGVLLKQGRLIEAEQSCRRATTLDPIDAEAWLKLGATLQGQEKFSDAELCYRRVLSIHPALVGAHSNLGGVLQQMNRDDEAEICCRRAIELDPRCADAHHNLGAVLRKRGQHSDAEISFRRALALNPSRMESHNSLAALLILGSRFTEAEACCREALATHPALAEAARNLGYVLQQTGRNTEAVQAYRRALAIDPNFDDAHSLLLFCLSHEEAVGPERLFAEHLAFGRRLEAPLRQGRAHCTNIRESARPLRIGFVSADLRDHAVSYFLEPVLAKLQGSYPDAPFGCFAYSNHQTEDSVSDRLRACFDQWVTVASFSDDALAAKIRVDRIDILIDLSGHTPGNRLPVFARKPAPLQASWIGYPCTTGLQAMDYYFSDRFFLPTSPAEVSFASQFAEKIIHLPAVSPFLPPSVAPPLSQPPVLVNGYVTFGSFNRLAKLNPQVVALWATLLRALPEAKLLLAALPPKGEYPALLEWFEREGIESERLKLRSRSGLQEYLELHNQVDLCLDTFPYGGCTTTVHALWMGVPTISLEGVTPAGREGAAFLRHVGLRDFIAKDKGDFIHKGMRWAQETTKLAELRSGMRRRVQHSLLGHPEIIAAGLATALRTMWQRRCAGLSPEAF